MDSQLKSTYQVERMKALFDGVLAVILTILVLGFEVPEHDFPREGLAAFFVKLREPFLAYAVTFGVVAAYWVQHAAIFHYVRTGNRAFVWLNIVFLLPLSLLPFLTDLRVEFHDEHRVTMLYVAANVLSGLVLLGIWRYAGRHGLTRPLPSEVDRSMHRRILLGVAIHLVGALVAPVSIHLSSLVLLTLPLIYLSHRVVDEHWSDASTAG